MPEVMDLPLKTFRVHEVVRVHHSDIFPAREVRDLIAAVSLPAVTTIISDEENTRVMGGLSHG